MHLSLVWLPDQCNHSHACWTQQQTRPELKEVNSEWANSSTCGVWWSAVALWIYQHIKLTHFVSTDTHRPNHAGFSQLAYSIQWALCPNMMAFDLWHQNIYSWSLLVPAYLCVSVLFCSHQPQSVSREEMTNKLPFGWSILHLLYGSFLIQSVTFWKYIQWIITGTSKLRRDGDVFTVVFQKNKHLMHPAFGWKQLGLVPAPPLA